jgi:hypothetical protein
MTNSLQILEQRTLQNFTTIGADLPISSDLPMRPTYILPTAFYYCCSHYTYEDLLRGRRRSNGFIATMTSDDQIVCVLGRTNSYWNRRSTFGWLKPDYDGAVDCTTHNQCAGVRKELFQNWWYPSPIFAALKPWKMQGETGICNSCVATSVQKHMAGRKKCFPPNSSCLLGRSTVTRCHSLVTHEVEPSLHSLGLGWPDDKAPETLEGESHKRYFVGGRPQSLPRMFSREEMKNARDENDESYGRVHCITLTSSANTNWFGSSLYFSEDSRYGMGMA